MCLLYFLITGLWSSSAIDDLVCVDLTLLPLYFLSKKKKKKKKKMGHIKANFIFNHYISGH